MLVILSIWLLVPDITQIYFCGHIRNVTAYRIIVLFCLVSLAFLFPSLCARQICLKMILCSVALVPLEVLGVFCQIKSSLPESSCLPHSDLQQSALISIT